MGNGKGASDFEIEMLPNLQFAYGLARWLLRNNQDAEDLVQEAYIRAFHAFKDYQGKNSKAWILTIVRNTCFTWIKSRVNENLHTTFDESNIANIIQESHVQNLILQNRDRIKIQQAVAALPIEFREVIILREWQELSYKEISEIINAPIGTVMSRLARARERLQTSLTKFSNGR